MNALLRAFHEEAAFVRGTAQITHDTSELAGFLAALYARGQAAHPKLRVSEEAFGRCVARCADGPSLQSLEEVAADDLYLACACAQKVRGAAAAFETEYRLVIRRAISRVVAARQDRDDAEQRALQHLLVGDPASGPAIARYRGTAPLAKWVPVVAIRVAMSLNRSESAERRMREKAGAEALGASPEDLYMRAELRRVLEPAIEEAVARLPDRDRLILQLYLVGGMTLQAIARSMGISQPAVSKRLAKTRAAVLDDIRATVAKRLSLPKSDFSSVMRFVASQLDVNISHVLRAK